MGLELNDGNTSSDIRYISRAINKEKTVKLKNGSLVYFAMNPLWFKDSKARQSQRITETARRNTQSIVLVDISVDPNSGILFDTVRDLLYHLGYTALGGTSVVKRYMGNDKLYKNKYKFFYESEFKGKIMGQGDRAPGASQKKR